MTGTIRFAKACNGLRVDFDLARRRRQLAAFWVLAETAQLSAIVGRLRYDQAIARPEFVEARRRQVAVGQRLPCRLIEMLEPLPDIAAFGEGFAGTEAFGE